MTAEVVAAGFVVFSIACLFLHWTLVRYRKARNEEGRCAYCGVALTGVPIEQIDLGNEDVELVTACVPCAQRKKTQNKVLWGLVAAFVAIATVCVLAMAITQT